MLHLTSDINKALRLLARPFEEFADPNANDLKYQAERLERISGKNSGKQHHPQHKTFLLSQALNARSNLIHGNIADSVFALSIYCIKYHDDWKHNGIDTKEANALGNNLYTLGVFCTQNYMWREAHELFTTASEVDRRPKRVKHYGLLALATAAMTQEPDFLSEVMELFEEFEEVNADVHATLQVLRLQSEALDPARLISYVQQLWKHSPIVTILVVAYRLKNIKPEDYNNNAPVVHFILNELPQAPGAQWAKALILGRQAIASQRCIPQWELLTVALNAWKHASSLQPRGASHEMREYVWREFGPVRNLAFEIASQMTDGELMVNLMELSRLNATVIATIEVESVEPDTQNLANSQHADPNEEDVLQNSETEKDHQSLHSLFLLMEHALNSVNISIPPNAARVFDDIINRKGSFAPSLSKIQWWLGLNRYEDSVFYALCSWGKPVDFGVLRLEEGDILLEILDVLATNDDYSLSPTQKRRRLFSNLDPFIDLAQWSTPEEDLITRSLGRLLPSVLQKALSKNNHNQLVLCVGEGFSGLPWPIVQIPDLDYGYVRLIERCNIRHWISKDAEVFKENLVNREDRNAEGQKLPLLVAINDPRGDLQDDCPELFELASLYISKESSKSFEDQMELKLSILQGFRQACQNKYSGLFYYRGHARGDQDPTYGYLELPIVHDAASLSEESALTSGEFFGRFENGSNWVHLPSRTVLSCCSSSARSLLGGETVGLAAGCILGAGTREVICTGTDVYDTSFTAALDSFLLKSMLKAGDHDALLRDVQIQMLNEWKTFSMRGGIDPSQKIDFPHPLIWALYQAY